VRRTKRLALAAPVALAALALSACGGSSGSGSGSSSSSAPASAAGGGSSAATGAASSAASSAPAGPADVKAGGELTFGADQEPTGFNTNTDKDNGTAAQNVVENVLPSVSIGQPDLGYKFNMALFSEEPKLASETPEVVEYKFKPEAKWSDGVPIGVDDIKFAWETQNGVDKAYTPASTTGYEDIASVEAVGSNKQDVKVTFKNKFGDWQSLFGNLVPFHTVDGLKSKFGGDIHKAWYDGLDKGLPVSGGPFLLKSYTQGSNAVLVRNDAYFGDKAKLDTITVRFLPESTTQPQALQNKEVQLIYPQPQLDLVQQVKGFPGVTSGITFGASFEHIDFNIQKPGLDDVAVRKAIATGLNVTGIIAKTVAQFSDQAKPLGNRIWLNTQKQYEDHAGSYGKGDIAAANSALDAAGYAKGAGGIRAKGPTKLSFKFTTTQGNALRQTTFELFQSQMKALGIEIQPDIRPSKVVFPDLTAHKFDIALFAWVGTPFPVSSNKSIYVSKGGQNYGFLSDPSVDAMFTQVTAELDPVKAAAAANEIDKKLWDNMVTIPLFQKPTFIAYDSKYANIQDNSTSDGPFYNSNTWGQKAQ